MELAFQHRQLLDGFFVCDVNQEILQESQKTEWLIFF